LIAAVPRITLPGVCLRGGISAKPKRVHSAASSKIVAGAQLNFSMNPIRDLGMEYL
jgi:hypothetical protein